jgi:hypothetical protein
MLGIRMQQYGVAETYKQGKKNGTRKRNKKKP